MVVQMEERAEELMAAQMVERRIDQTYDSDTCTAAW